MLREGENNVVTSGGTDLGTSAKWGSATAGGWVLELSLGGNAELRRVKKGR